jgi:hypothetical protein
MDLHADEFKVIKNFVTDWVSRPEQNLELESTFGTNGRVDATTFLAIAQRLRAKGLEPLPQDDRLTIIVKPLDRKDIRADKSVVRERDGQMRISLFGPGVLESYCRDDLLEGKPFTAMIKDRTRIDGNLNLKEYDVRIKLRRELTLSGDDPRVRDVLTNWKSSQFGFRLIRRWSFKGPGYRVDMSMIRSTPQDSRGQFQWQTSFLKPNVLKQPAHYEVEVELEHDAEENKTVDNTIKTLIKGIGEVLRAIQKNSILITKSMREKVFSEYAELNGSPMFRGVKPVGILKENMIAEINPKIPNIRTGYNVTDKADGLRCLGFCNSKGDLFMIDMAMNIYRTGLRNNKCANSLVDGEWITLSGDKKPLHEFLLFDIYKAPGKEDVGDLPFANTDNIEKEDGRWNRLRSWCDNWSKDIEFIGKGVTEANMLTVAMKTFVFAKATDPLSIFEACREVLAKSQIYYTDGLILTPNLKPLPEKSLATFEDQFKWKPAKDNTVDFLINIEKSVDYANVDKITAGLNPVTGEQYRFKTIRLYVGSSRNPIYDDPRNSILDEVELPDLKQKRFKETYKPMLFNPDEFPDTMANTCYVPVVVDPETQEDMIICEDGDPIVDKSIVEMRYDPTKQAGWRWIPSRVRHDKTEILQDNEKEYQKQLKDYYRGKKEGRKDLKYPVMKFSFTMNAEKTANSVWRSIHDPVTVSMMKTGNDTPTKDELDALSSVRESIISRVYYDRSEQKDDFALVRGMRDFHNHYIKDELLYKTVLSGGSDDSDGGKSVIDFACGKGGDMNIWRKRKARFVFGVDLAGDNILDEKNGIYRRYLNDLMKFGKDSMPIEIFAIGNSAKDIATGDAGANDEESDIMRSVMGRVAPKGPVRKYVETVAAGGLRQGADVGVCMFAIHYFFENIDMLDGLMRNISECVKPGGYFIGCCFDGQRVFDALRRTEQGGSLIGKEGETFIWSIRKEYDADALTDDDDSVGLAIDVKFISIGTEQREYLVSFEYLKRRMRKIGFELLTDAELKDVGLQHSTNVFEESFKMAKSRKSKQDFALSDTVKRFSFLNRWFIFKRKAMAGAEEVSPAEMVAELEKGAQAEKLATSLLPREGADGEVMNEVEEAEEKPALAGPGEDARYRLPSDDATFVQAQIFSIGPDVALQDALKLGKRDSTGSGRWLALRAPFPIRDLDDEEDTTEYPSVEHFMAGMMVKYAGKNPKIAGDLFGQKGEIHQEYEDERRIRAGGKEGKLSDTDYYKILGKESDAIKKALTAKALKPYKVVIDEAFWTTLKDKYLRSGLEQRWARDKRFQEIVNKANESNKYILYISGEGGVGELGGIRRTSDGRIIGENKVGKIIMELAGFKF